LEGATRQAEVLPPARIDPVAVRQNVCAVVTDIDLAANRVKLKVAKEEFLLVGDQLTVTHEYLLKISAVGCLEVVSTSCGVVARPLGRLNLDKVSRGDRAWFDPVVNVSGRFNRAPGKNNRGQAAESSRNR
jgi:hypothetical protein